MEILALCGSLRAASINAMLLRAVARLAAPEIRVTRFDLAALPLFNPDLEADPPAAAVALEAALARADALLIASPEYAHGVTGTIKNALDWLVGGSAFVDKPMALFNAAPRAHHSDDALRETLRTMSGRLVEEACIALPLLGADLDEETLLQTPALTTAIHAALADLQAAARAA